MLKKFQKPVIAGMIMLAAGIIVIIAGLIVIEENLRMRSYALEQEKSIAGYERAYGTNPKEALSRQTALLAELTNKYANLKNIFIPNDTGLEKPLTPLLFKQKLFTVCDSIHDRAKRESIVVPESLGFSEYFLKVPEPALIPVLTRELSMMEGVVDALLNSKIDAITGITFTHKSMDITRSAVDGETIVFPTVALSIVFEADYPRIQKFLTNIRRSPGVCIVRKLEMKRIEPRAARLIATIKIESVMWE